MTTARPYRVIVVDDHRMVLDAITSALARRDDIEVAGRAGSVAEAIGLLELSTVDVLVTDLHLQDGTGTDLVTYASRMNPPVPVLLITGSDGRNAVDAALASGCAGFVSKVDGFERLVDALLAVARGAAVFPAALLSASLVADPAGDHSLSAREHEILQLLANALSVPVIAERLHLSTHTVRNHVKQILSKLDAHTQLEAVVIAARAGIVELH